MVVRENFLRLMAMEAEAQEELLGELATLSGVRKAGGLPRQKLKERRMLIGDLENNAIVRPLLAARQRNGRQEWADERVNHGTEVELQRSIGQALECGSVEVALDWQPCPLAFRRK